MAAQTYAPPPPRLCELKFINDDIITEAKFRTGKDGCETKSRVSWAGGW